MANNPITKSQSIEGDVLNYKNSLTSTTEGLTKVKPTLILKQTERIKIFNPEFEVTHKENESLSDNERKTSIVSSMISDHENSSSSATLNSDELNQIAIHSIDENIVIDEEIGITDEFYKLSAFDHNGEIFEFSKLKGKLVLVVNIATQCAAAYQMKIFERIYQEYKDQNFIIIGFPSNQFFQERTASNEETFVKCTKKYNVTFPIMEKIRLNGKNQHEVFRYLKSQKKGFLGSRRVKWNFEKFLIDRKGQVIKRYSTRQKNFPGHIKEFLTQEENSVNDIGDLSLNPRKSTQQILYI
ncbi:hypothetical protein WICMUC_002771 [Wickerhamomyces mucosus]|uniref:Glutathione peroxidase n=1 Tax=Wickerhamomyces mucosus TaxID=1378264 RepID=A0A9P8PP60_9ASCO|nr:hypothetical protein WICMUC_002771 [Wickerhamomyces mucosus]